MDRSIPSVTSASLFLLRRRGPARADRNQSNHWDPTRLVVAPEADELLDQHAEFVLVVTEGINDASGKKILSSSEYRDFLEHGTGEYHDRLVAGIAAAARSGVPAGQIVTASVFTTMSVTSILERSAISWIRRDPNRRFSHRSLGIRAVFSSTRFDR
jgi:hypothetical protein